ncbi:MAG: hypothetical protein ACE5JG_06440, partial [Planctomycetota bacterium]
MRVLVILCLLAAVAVGVLTCGRPPDLVLTFRQGPAQPEFINMANTPGGPGVQSARLWQIQVRSRVSKPITLRVRLEDPVPEGMRARLSGEIDLLPRGEGRIGLHVTPPAALGPFEGALTIYAEGDEEVHARFPFRGEVVRAHLQEPYLRVEALPDRPLRFGAVAPGTSREIAFRVRNYGGADLVVERWEPDDGVRLHRVRGGETIAAGGALEVRGTARAPTGLGRFALEIRIHSNAANSPVWRVVLAGEVVVAYRLTPAAVVDRHAVRFHRPEYATVAEAEPGAEPFTIGRITGGEDLLEVVSRGGAEPSRRQEVRVRLRRDTRLGRHLVRVRIRVDPAGIDLDWSLRLFVVPTVVADPPEVDFGEIRPGSRVRHEVRLVSTVGRKFEVRDVRTEHGLVLAVTRAPAGLAPT